MSTFKCWRGLAFLFSIMFFSAGAIAMQTQQSKKNQPSVSNEFLKAEPPLTLPGKVARFDYMEVDTDNDRLLAAHSAAGSLAVVDLKTGKLLTAIEVGEVHGVAIDSKSGTYILGDGAEHKVVFVSSKSLKVIGEIKVSGPVDAIAFDSKSGFAYAGEDDGSHLWVIDVQSKKLISTIGLSGVPEFIAYDPSTDRLFQNIKTKDSVSMIDPNTNKVQMEWKTAPVASPHGLAIDSSSGRIFIAGRNRKLIALDTKSGQLLGEADIAENTDQISFDKDDKIIYCASKGFISAVKETDKGIQSLASTSSPKGAHTIAVDILRHEVWVSYADESHSYLQKFKKSKN
jgi:DNA-binding beta-propeller fold protein YncE